MWVQEMMTGSSGQFYETVNKLSKQSGTLQEYEDLLIILRNLPRNELENAVSKHGLLDIFSHINLDNGNFSETALDIAVIIFSTFRLTEFAHSHESELLMSITSSNLPLRDFVIARLTDGVEKSSPDDVDIPLKILLEISKIAITEEITTASSARSFLMAFGINHPDGVNILTNDASLKSFFNSLARDVDIIRLSEIFAYIASQQNETFTDMQNHTAFNRLVSIIDKNDPLLLLNTLAVLKLLLSFPGGRAFLKSSGVVAHLFTGLQTLKENPLRDLLLPGYISFFATLAKEEPIDFLANPTYKQPFADCLAYYLTTTDPTIMVAVIEAIAEICTTLEGKRVLAVYLKPEACLCPLFSKAASVMKNATAGTLPRVLLALADILSLPNTDHVSTLLPISELTYEWFNLLSAPSTPDYLFGRIWELAKQPFKEVRSAALKLLYAIATEPWGVALSAQQPGFLEYLFNPTTEVGTAVNGSSLQPEKFKIAEQCSLTQERWNGLAIRWTLLDNETAARVKRGVEGGIWGETRVQAAVVAMENE